MTACQAVAGIFLPGAPVETNDGRLGYVLDQKFRIDAHGRMMLEGYSLQLTEGRGRLFKSPEKVRPVEIIPHPLPISREAA
jgi:hypothetical protein